MITPKEIQVVIRKQEQLSDLEYLTTVANKVTRATGMMLNMRDLSNLAQSLRCDYLTKFDLWIGQGDSLTKVIINNQ